MSEPRFSRPDPPERPGDPPPPGGHVRPVLLGGPGGFLTAASAVGWWAIAAGADPARTAIGVLAVGAVLAPPAGLLAGTVGAELARRLHRRRSGGWNGRTTSFAGAYLGGTAAVAAPVALYHLL